VGALTRGQVLKYHPLSELFPLLHGEEFDALVEDIRVHRLHEAIVLHEGKILRSGSLRGPCARAAPECGRQ
jgi:hypothetical protein